MYKYQPELRQKPDARQQAIFDASSDVGILAHQLFPGGEDLTSELNDIPSNLIKTQGLINSGAQTIYEATFLYDDVLVMVDILHRGPDGWELYEVKSSTEVKDVHVSDVGIQHYVLQGSGLQLSKVALVYINNEYVRQGDLDIPSLFSTADLTETIKAEQQAVKENLDRIKASVQPNSSVPVTSIGPQCNKPYECDFMEYCWSHIPTPSVFDLASMRSVRKFALYDKKIITFDQIPDGCNLTDAQKMQVEAEIHGTVFIDKEGIREFVQKVAEPIGFMDFETFDQAVPQFNNQRPYQKIPFQYSLHILDKGELRHHHYLADAHNDPRPEFVQKLIADTESCSVIMVYNQGFEKSVLTQLAEWFPIHANQINKISERIVDLMEVFQKRFYYTREMNGRYSIKSVLPAVVPGLTYSGMDIANGDMAMNAFKQLQNLTDEVQIQKIRDDLLKYCELDTLAMVEIFKKLKDLVRK